MTNEATPSCKGLDPFLWLIASGRDVGQMLPNGVGFGDREGLLAKIELLAIRLRRVALAALQENELTSTQARILFALTDSAGPQSGVELARRIGLSSPVVGEACATLRARNLVMRDQEVGGRRLRLMLTPRGKVVAKRLSAWDWAFRERVGNLTPIARSQCLKHLEYILAD